MKIIVIGCHGNLGTELCAQLGSEGIGLSRKDLDITDRIAVNRMFRQYEPDVVINTAAYTSVDQAELEVDACFATNSTAVMYLAEACTKVKSTLVQISTDYVFDAAPEKQRPYCETDAANPRGIYARSKKASEAAAATTARHFIVRTCGLYGVRNSATQSNFVESMLRLGSERATLRVVDDQWCTPTFVRDVAQSIRYLICSSAYGLYHVVNRGSTTWHAFAREIFRRSGLTVNLNAISTAQYAALAPRPKYSVLDTHKFESLGGPQLRNWQDALSEYLALRGNSSSPFRN